MACQDKGEPREARPQTESLSPQWFQVVPDVTFSSTYLQVASSSSRVGEGDKQGFRRAS